MYAEKNIIHIKKSRAILMCIIVVQKRKGQLYTLKSRNEILLLTISTRSILSTPFWRAVDITPGAMAKAPAPGCTTNVHCRLDPPTCLV